MKVEIIVLNYNGGGLFLECLATLVAAAGKSRHQTTVTVLDNQSKDGSETAAERRFPSVKIYRAPENKVLCSYNSYLARETDCDIAILLNNDIKADPDFVDALIAPFEENVDTFLVTPHCKTWDGTGHDGGVTRFRMKWGIFWASSRYPGYEKDLHSRHETMAAGFGAFDRKKFLALGGYDELYLPGRLEDSDICLLAWRRGWKLYCEPQSVVYHKGAVAFDKAFSKSGTLKIGHRNSFLFVWKSIHDAHYLAAHFLLLPFRLTWAALRGQTEFVEGFKEALPLFMRAWSKRTKPAAGTPSDAEIFSKV